MNWSRLKNLFIGGFFAINLLLGAIRILVDLPPASASAIAARTLTVLHHGGITVRCEIPWESTVTSGVPETGFVGIDREKIVSALTMAEDEATRSLLFIGADTLEYFDAGLDDREPNRHVRMDGEAPDLVILRLLRDMGIAHMNFSADVCPPDSRREDEAQEADGAVVCLTGIMPGGMRAFDDGVLARFDQDGLLVYLRLKLSGITGESDRIPVIPAYKILLAGESDYSVLEDIALGYHRTPGSSVPAAVWRLVTDSGVFYYDAVTGRDISPDL